MAAGAGEKGFAGSGNPSFPKNWRRSGGDWPLPLLHGVNWRGGKRGCHPPPPLCAAREFLPRVPRPAWPSHGVRLGDPLCLLVNTPTPPEKCTSPPTRLPSGGHGIHRTHAATEGGILPRQASVIRGRSPTLPSSPPLSQGLAARAPGAGLGEHNSRPRDLLPREVTALGLANRRPLTAGRQGQPCRGRRLGSRLGEAAGGPP